MSAEATGGVLFVITGTSGSGKDSVIDGLRARGEKLSMVVTAVTRRPRPTERDGVNHHFVTKSQFQRWKDEGKLLEWAEVYGRFYGTPRWEVEEPLARGEDVMLRVDVQGAAAVRAQMPRAVLIFIAAPSLEESRRRVGGRNVETAAELEARFARFELEMSFSRECDYVVINETDQLERTIDRVQAAMREARAARRGAARSGSVR